MKSRRAVRLAVLGALFCGLLAFAASCQKRAEAPASGTPAAGAVQDSGSSAVLLPGQAAFLSNCAMCHGTWGAGDGPLAAQMEKEAKVRPANLTDGVRLQSIGRKEVRHVMEVGGGHSGRSNLMPPWHDRLDEKTIDQIADFVMTLPDLSPATPSTTLEAFLAAPPGSAPDGRKLFVFYCTMCHGPEGRGNGQFADTLVARNGIRPRDLTDSTYFAAKSDQDLEVTVALGGAHSHKSAYMPAWSVTLTPAQIKDLVSYVRAISRTPSH